MVKVYVISIFLQIVIAFAISAICMYLADYLQLRTYWHAIWMFALPAGIGIIANEERHWQLSMTFILMLVSVISVMLTAAVFGLAY